MRRVAAFYSARAIALEQDSTVTPRCINHQTRISAQSSHSRSGGFTSTFLQLIHMVVVTGANSDRSQRIIRPILTCCTRLQQLLRDGRHGEA